MSGTVQYLRKASLVIGGDKDGLDLSELRFRFFVRRGDIQTPNTVDIRVYNLAPDTSKKIEKEFTRVVLQAGYDGNFGLIFDGTIKQVRRGRESQTDTYLDITAADGDQAYNYAVTAVSLAAGQTSPKNQLETVIKSMAQHNVSQGYIPESLPGQTLPRGKVFYGMSRDVMRQVSGANDTSWSIQDGKVDVIPLQSYKPSSEIPVINYQTGMIGLPEQTSNGIRIKVLLNPQMKIGQIVQIDNKSILQYRYQLSTGAAAQNESAMLANKISDDGFYYIMLAEHSGDTRGQNWYTSMICLAADATLTPSAFQATARYPIPENVIKRYP